MNGALGVPCYSHSAQHSLPGFLVKLFKFYLHKLTCADPWDVLFGVLRAPPSPQRPEDFLIHNFLSFILFPF